MEDQGADDINKFLNNYFNTGHRMQLRAYYKKMSIILANNSNNIPIHEGGRHDIDTPTGFVIYHKHLRRGLPESVLPFQFPPVQPWMIEYFGAKEVELIKGICKDIEEGGGLHVNYNPDDGCVYATRYSSGHVFFWANDRRDSETVPLVRKEPTCVFNFTDYFKKILADEDALRNERNPVIVFTFGVPWYNGSSSLQQTPVHAEVTPIPAVELLQSLVAGRFDIKSIAKSINLDDIRR